MKKKYLKESCDEIDKEVYLFKKINRKLPESFKTPGGELELTEEIYKEIYEVIFFELDKVIAKNFFNFISLLAEDFILLSKKYDELTREIPTIKENMENEISKENTQQITNLENEISNARDEISELTQSKKNLKNIEKQFKNFLICHHFKNRKKLLDKPLDFILELFESTKELRNIEKITHHFNKKINLPIDLNSYVAGSLCVCGLLKSKNSKGCNSCRLKADSGRKKDNQSMESS